MDESNRDFFNLDVWKRAHLFVLEIYKLTLTLPANERFGITSQIRRSASSITANIAEGYERFYYKDKRRFYYNARGSLAETQNFIFLIRDLQFISPEIANRLLQTTKDIAKLINGLINYTENKLAK